MKNSIAIILIATFSLIACSDNNSTEEIITELPSACFSTSTNQLKVSESIEFYNCSENATHFYWDFGDGNTSNSYEPSHTYTKQGVYEVSLLAGKDKNQDGVLDSLDDPAFTVEEITVQPNHLSVQLTILSASNWTPQAPGYQLVTNAVVDFYKEYPEDFTLGEPDYTLTSDENGQIKIFDNEIEAVCFVVEKEEESNIVNGLLIDGVFENQSQIDSWAETENATIGSYKYIDLNGDGIIDNNDKAPCESISISLNETFEKDVYIGK